MSYTPGSHKIRCAEKPKWSYTPESRDSLVSLVMESRDSLVSFAPGSSFTVSVNLQDHATAFKATLIKKIVKKLIVTLTIQNL